MTINKATDTEIQAFLKEHESWSLDAGKLHREFEFSNFIEAFAFMTKVAIVAQGQDHHPEWFNVYKKVVIDLTTHEAAGISGRDFKLANEIESLASS